MSQGPKTYDPLWAKTRVALGFAFAFVFGLGLAAQLGFTTPRFAIPQVATEARLETSAIQPALTLSDAFVNIAETVTPSVVRIEARRQRPQTRGTPEELRRFFRTPPRENEQPNNSLPELVTAGGSGFIVSPDGYILTNNHVVDGASSITVILNDRRTLSATVVGADPTTDVAVLKVDGEDLPTSVLGASSEVRVGEWIVAIGNPGFSSGNSLDYTVTAGIVSALGRGLQLLSRDLQNDPRFANSRGSFAIEDFIQTDAVINPGNSGGPMVNIYGQVVGINSAIASLTGYYQGYGFAIPIDLAQRVMEDLIAYGRVRRAYLGVRMETVAPEDAEYFGLPAVAGALIQAVERGTPAEGAELRARDVIVEIDGEEVISSNDLQHKIALKSPGDRISLTVYRNRSPIQITVNLDEVPFSEAVAEAPPRVVQSAEKIGIEVANLTPDVAERLELANPEGTFIENIQQGGAAARRGVRPGEVIREINGQTITTTDDVERAFQSIAPGEVVSLLLEAGGSTRVVNVRVPQ